MRSLPAAHWNTTGWLRVVRDQSQDRHELVARRVENRHVAVGECPVDDVVGLERRDGRVDQRLVHDPDAGGFERGERCRLDFVLPPEVDDELDAALLDEVHHVGRLDVGE